MVKLENNKIILNLNNKEFNKSSLSEFFIEFSLYFDFKKNNGEVIIELESFLSEYKNLKDNKLYETIFKKLKLSNELNSYEKAKADMLVDPIVDFDKEYQNNVDFKKFVQNVLEKIEVSISGPFGAITKKQLSKIYETSKLGNTINFSEPGSGKTLMTLMDIASKIKSGKEYIVIVAPLNSMFVWRSEIKKFFKADYNNKVYFVNASYNKFSDEKVQYLDITKQKFIIVNYDSVSHITKHSLVMQKLKEDGFIAVFDEAHRVKSDKAVRNIQSNDLAKNSISNITLTGTPISKTVYDLKNIIDLTWANKENPFINKSEFEDFATNNDIYWYDKNDKVQIEEIKRFAEEIEPLYIALRKTEDFKIKPAIDNHSNPIKTGKNYPFQMKMDKFLVESFLKATQSLINGVKMGKDRKELEKRVTFYLSAMLVNSTNPIALSKWSFIKNNPEKFNYFIKEAKKLEFKKLPKIEVALEYVQKKVRAGERVMVWFNFVDNIKEFTELLVNNGINAKCIYGETKIEDREEIIKDLSSEDSAIDVLVSNPATIAESVSLHKSITNSLFVERDYTYFRWAQAKDRIHRVGSDKQVYHDYIIDNELKSDVRLFENMSKKEEFISKVLKKDYQLGIVYSYDSFTDEKSFERYASDINEKELEDYDE